MDAKDSRKTPRYSAEMSLRSTGLPLLQAKVVDLSATGARLHLRAAAPPTLVRQVIRFGASLPGQQTPFFEGSARVAWVRQTASGWQAGLEWEKLPAQDKTMLDSVLDLLV